MYMELSMRSFHWSNLVKMGQSLSKLYQKNTKSIYLQFICQCLYLLHLVGIPRLTAICQLTRTPSTDRNTANDHSVHSRNYDNCQNSVHLLIRPNLFTPLKTYTLKYMYVIILKLSHAFIHFELEVPKSVYFSIALQQG